MASFGENLRRERELRGVDLREMADATKISIRFLQALEQDRVDVLPGGIFPRAFVKQYAKYLGLDADRMVSEFDFAHGKNDASAPRKPAPEVYDGGMPRGILVVVVVVLGLAFLAWRVAFHRGTPEEAPAASPAVALPPQAARPEDRVYPP